MDDKAMMNFSERGAGPSETGDATGGTPAGREPVDTTTTTTFGTWLRTQRKEHDLTQEGLAERAGCSWEMVRKIESGAARPSRQLAELLAAAFDIPPAERP